MRLSQSLGALVLMASASIAHAQLSGTVTAVSDYNLRGITQTADDPALQGSIDWAADSGLYLGAWASNIDFGNSFDADIEVDLYAGFTRRRRHRLGRRLHLLRLSGRNRCRLPRAVRERSPTASLTGKIWYSNEFGGFGNDSSLYYDAERRLGAAVANFGLNAHLGYSDGDGDRRCVYGDSTWTGPSA